MNSFFRPGTDNLCRQCTSRFFFYEQYIQNIDKQVTQTIVAQLIETVHVKRTVSSLKPGIPLGPFLASLVQTLNCPPCNLLYVTSLLRNSINSLISTKGPNWSHKRNMSLDSWLLKLQTSLGQHMLIQFILNIIKLIRHHQANI